MHKTIGISVILLLIAEQSFAQQPLPVLTLREASRIALEQHFSIKVARNAIERDETGVQAAYGTFLPNLSLGGSWGGGSGESFLPSGERLPSTQSRSLSTNLRASVILFDGFANTSNLNAARSTVLSSENTLHRTRQSVMNQTYSLYYNVLRTERLLRISESSVDYNKKLLERIGELARLGSASLVNVYQQESQLGQEELRLVQAQNEYELAKANLLAYIGVDIQQKVAVADPAIPEDVDTGQMRRLIDSLMSSPDLVETAFERRPDYISSRLNLEAATSNVTSARSGYFPTVSASAGYSMSGAWTNRTSLLGSTTAASNEFSDFGNNRNLNWSLSFSFPIFSGWSTDYRTQSALVTKRNAEENLKESERKIKVEVYQAILLLQAAKKNYEASVKSLEFQDKNLKINQEKYNIGSGTYLDLMFAENNYKSALTSKINAVYQFLTAKIQLELAVGIVQPEF